MEITKDKGLQRVEGLEMVRLLSKVKFETFRISLRVLR
jgi:hypothetical protein